MDPVTLIALTLILAVGIPMMTFIGCKLYERLEEDKLTPMGTPTRTEAPTPTTTTEQETWNVRERTKTRRRPRRTNTIWAAIPITISMTALAAPLVEGWSRLITSYPAMARLPLGPATPILAVTATLTILTIYNSIH